MKHTWTSREAGDIAAFPAVQGTRLYALVNARLARRVTHCPTLAPEPVCQFKSS
jgi:hypothetical protein